MTDQKKEIKQNKSGQFIAGKVHWNNDILSGIIVALVSIPISMGYAQIAGLPVIYGLYGSLLPILIFGFLTTSPQFVVGVDAMPAAMVGGLLATLGVKAESEQAMKVVPMVALLVAIWFVIFYFLKAGRIVKFISTPVMGGFISGVGTSIILMQVPKLWGGTAGTGELYLLVKHMVHERHSFNGLSLGLGLGTILVILLCKKWIPKVPMLVIMMVVGMALQIGFHLDDYGVKLLPQVSGGLPHFVLPDFSVMKYDPVEMLIQSLSIAAVIMTQTLLATGNYAMKYQDDVDNNRELLAYAGMNVGGALVGCCPINGSVSRSGVADSYGCKSQVMSITASITMLLILLFGTPLLKFLPVPVLTGIVMTALIGIIEFSLAERLRKTSKNEWIVFMISFGGVLLFGTVYGVMIGCILSFAVVAIKAVAPSTAFLGRIPGEGNFYPLNRNMSARPIKNTLIYRFNGNLFFANIDRFEKDIESGIQKDTKQVVVDARGIDDIDVTAVDRLMLFRNHLLNQGIHFYITEHEGILNDRIRRLGGGKMIDEGVMRRTITLALRDAGLHKPYDLADAENDGKGKNFIESEERLAEFEWAFGDEAEARFEQMAKETAEHLVATIAGDVEHKDVFGTDALKTTWGLIGRYDEDEFFDYLEIALEQLANQGRITKDDATKLEQLVEERRERGEMRLQELNPKAMEILLKHRREIRDQLKAQLPEEYARVHNLRKQRRLEKEKE